VKLGDKTIENFSYDKEDYSLEVKDLDLASSNNIRRGIPKTPDRINGSRGKLNILMTDNSFTKEDTQLDSVDLDRNSSTSPITVEKVNVKPWKGKNRRREA
jgi:hypothetical protein